MKPATAAKTEEKHAHAAEPAPHPAGVYASDHGAPGGMPLFLRAAGFEVGPARGPAEDQADDAARRAAASPITPAGAPAGGQILANPLRKELETHAGGSLDGVRIHSDASAAALAGGLGARAFAYGRDIYFGAGEYNPDSQRGRAMLAHEATHVVQQRANGGAPSVQRIPMDWEPPQSKVPPPPPTPEAVGLPTSKEAAADPQRMPAYLGRQDKELKQLQDQVASADPKTPEERDALRAKLERLVRINAIGLMAAHRANIVEARERVLAKRTGPNGAGKPDTVARSKELEDIREAARAVNKLNETKEKLEDHRRQLHYARSDSIFRRGDVVDTIKTISDHGFEYLERDQIGGVLESFSIAKSRNTRSDYWLFAYGASTYLEDLRSKQIFGVEQSVSSLYEQYPMFASLKPEDVVGKDMESDEALLKASEKAYNDVIANVDNAIGRIAVGGIHPFDMPKAVQVTRAMLPGPGQKALDEAKQDREVTKFWLTIGLSLLEAVVVFIPVVGPVIAVGIAVGMIANQLDDMLERVRIAKASANPYKDTVGVSSPSPFEWVMLGIGAILTAVGAAGVFRSLKGALREPPPELLAEIGEPSGTTTWRPGEVPYENPPEMQTLRGRKLDFNTLDPNKKYLWVIDEHGNFLLAPEHQAPTGFSPGRQPPGVVKHGDLTPGPGGQTRGVARAGGEMYAEVVNGKPTGRWIMDNNSSYTFARTAGGGQELPASSLEASKRLLGHYGTDTSLIQTKDVLPR
jgi:Domain of unknown function (DUF4157)